MNKDENGNFRLVLRFVKNVSPTEEQAKRGDKVRLKDIYVDKPGCGPGERVAVGVGWTEIHEWDALYALGRTHLVCPYISCLSFFFSPPPPPPPLQHPSPPPPPPPTPPPQPTATCLPPVSLVGHGPQNRRILRDLVAPIADGSG